MRTVIKACATTITALIVTTLLSACTEPTSSVTPVTPKGAGLEVVTAAKAPVPTEVTFDGVIEAVNQAVVSAQTTGRILEMPFDVGDLVAAGTLIVRLTDSEQKSRVASAKGALEEAQAGLAEAVLIHERDREVFEKKLIARAQFDRSAAALDSAEARVAAAKGALATAQENLARTEIHAPYSGVVVARHAHVGETVAPGTPLMAGLTLEVIRAIVEIPQQQLPRITSYEQARVILPDGESISATRLRIPPRADVGSQTFRALVELPEGNYETFPGTLVKVAFTTGQDRQLLIPWKAVVRRGEITGVYVVQPDKLIEFRYVRVGRTLPDTNVVILAGIRPGEDVATDPIAAGILYKQQSGDES